MVGVVSLRGFAFAASMALIALPGESWAQSRQGDWAAPGVNCADIDKHADERLLRIMSRSIIWYEATCRIIGEKIIGDRYTLQTLCDAEGQKERRTTVVDMLPNGDISISGVRYRRCPLNGSAAANPTSPHDAGIAPPASSSPPSISLRSKSIEGGDAVVVEQQPKPEQKAGLSQRERDALGELIAMIGKPRNDAEAIAQNTVVIMEGAAVCGYVQRVRRYQEGNTRDIARSLSAAYGNRARLEQDRITEALIKWLVVSADPAAARKVLCTMVDGSLTHLGF